MDETKFGVTETPYVRIPTQTYEAIVAFVQAWNGETAWNAVIAASVVASLWLETAPKVGGEVMADSIEMDAAVAGMEMAHAENVVLLAFVAAFDANELAHEQAREASEANATQDEMERAWMRIDVARDRMYAARRARGMPGMPPLEDGT